MDIPRSALPPGVLSLHILPAEHHDRDWDAIIVPREVKTRLLTETIPEIAARRPHVIVLIDEVESFAVRRSTASFEANPVDVHRATDAVLLGVDEIAKNLPSVLFVTTTNFIEAVDEAFLS